MIDVLRGEHGEAAGCGQFRHGMEPEVLLRIVDMREDSGNLDAVPQQRLDTHTADVVIGQDHRPHFNTSDCDRAGICPSPDFLRPMTR